MAEISISLNISALNKLEIGEISFMKACEISILNVWSFAELVKNSEVVWIKREEDIKKDIRAGLEIS